MGKLPAHRSFFPNAKAFAKKGGIPNPSIPLIFFTHSHVYDIFPFLQDRQFRFIMSIRIAEGFSILMNFLVFLMFHVSSPPLLCDPSAALSLAGTVGYSYNMTLALWF